jgi:hypothetical protein
MRFRLFLFIILAVTAIGFILFKMNEDVIITKLTPFFPSKDENTPGYYADMIAFVAEEIVWIVALVVASAFLIRRPDFNALFTSIEDRLVAKKHFALPVVCFAFVIITVFVATAGLEQFPNSADEYAYLFQAQQLSEGKLWDEVHPKHEFFEFHHLAHKDGKWVGRFPPGWPLLQSLAYILHIPPFIVNTLLGLLGLIITFKLFRRIYDERVAMWSAIAMAFTSFYIFNSATFFSHMAALVEGLLFIYFCYRFVQEQRTLFAFLAGLFLGILVMTRQLNAVIFFLPVVAYLCYELKFKAIKPLIIIGLGAIPGVAVFLWYNYSITGDPFVPVTMWTNADEALGFVKGHTPAKGAKFTFKRFMMFFYFASPILLILYFFYLVHRLRDIRKIFAHPEDYFFLLLVAGYFFYYHSGGNQYGPRFYLEGLPFLIGFVVVKVLRSTNSWARPLLFCAVAFNLIRIPFIAHREHRVVEERKDIYAQAAAMKLKDAVVFIGSETGVIRPMPIENLNRNDRDYQNEVLFARDLGTRNIELMKFYPGKSFYLYKRKVDVVRGELIKVDDAQMAQSPSTN